MLAQGTVDLDLLRHQLGEHLVVAAALGLGDEHAHLALAALEVAKTERVQCVLHLLGERLRRRVAAFRADRAWRCGWRSPTRTCSAARS